MHHAGHSVFFKHKDGKVYIGWRMLGTDPENIAFNEYRNNICVNSKPITKSHDPIYRLSVLGRM